MYFRTCSTLSNPFCPALQMYQTVNVILYMFRDLDAKCTILSHISSHVPLDGNPVAHIIGSHDLTSSPNLKMDSLLTLSSSSHPVDHPPAKCSFKLRPHQISSQLFFFPTYLFLAFLAFSAEYSNRATF